MTGQQGEKSPEDKDMKIADPREIYLVGSHFSVRETKQRVHT